MKSDRSRPWVDICEDRALAEVAVQNGLRGRDVQATDAWPVPPMTYEIFGLVLEPKYSVLALWLLAKRPRVSVVR